MRPEIQGPADAQPLARGRSDKGRRPGGAHRVEVGQQSPLGPGAVFQIDDQPVETGAREELRRDGRSEPGECAVQRLPGAESRVEVDEAGDGRQGGRIGHGYMMRGRTRGRFGIACLPVTAWSPS